VLVRAYVMQPQDMQLVLKPRVHLLALSGHKQDPLWRIVHVVRDATQKRTRIH